MRSFTEHNNVMPPQRVGVGWEQALNIHKANDKRNEESFYPTTIGSNHREKVSLLVRKREPWLTSKSDGVTEVLSELLLRERERGGADTSNDKQEVPQIR